MNDKVLISIKKGCKYLLKNTKKNGTKFIYLRDVDGRIINGKYNMLRHCGCLWALSKTYNSVLFESCNDETMKTLNGLFEYPKKHTNSSIHNDQNNEDNGDKNNQVALLKDKQWYKLGGNALYALSLHEYKTLTSKLLKTSSNSRSNDKSIKKDDTSKTQTQLCRHIHNGMKQFINKNGSIKHYKINANTNAASDFVSEYYPGEAILSLCILKDYETAFKITNQLKKTRDAGVNEEEQIHDHWLLQGIEMLYFHYKNNENENDGNEGNKKNKKIQMLTEYGNRIGQAIIKHEDKYKNRSCRIACRLEGLIPLYRMTKNKEYLDAINKLVKELLKSQCIDATHKACGAFKDDGGYQIDYTQHSVSALCEYYKLMNEV
jgi:hypothetical protein